MKNTMMILLAASLFTAPALFAAPYAKDSQTPKLLRDAQNVTRTKDIEKTLQAYAQVFQQKDLTIQDRVNAHFSIASVYMNQKPQQRAKAIEETKKILTLKDARPEDKIRVYYFEAEKRFADNFPGSGYVNDDKGILDAMAIYKEALNIQGLSNISKLETIKRIANCYLEIMDVKSANSILADGVKLSGLTDEEKGIAMYNQAEVFRRQLSWDLAEPIYFEILKNKSARRNTKDSILFTMADRIMAKDGYDKAIDFLKKQPESEKTIERFVNRYNDKAVIESLIAQLNDKKIDPRTRARFLCNLMERALKCRNLSAVEKAFTYVPELIQADKNWVDRALNMFIGRTYWQTPIWNDRPDILDRGLAEVAKYKGNELPFLEMQLWNATTKGDSVAEKAILEKLVKLENLAEQKKIEYECALIAINEDNGKKAADKISKIVMKATDEKLRTQKNIADILQKQAQKAHKAERYDFAKAMWAERAKMIVQDDPRSIPVTFIKNGPRDITQFLSSPYIKDQKNIAVMDRKYGDNLKFVLETDVAIVGRNITADTGKGSPTTFVATCDESYVRLFFMMPCDRDRAMKLRNGFGGYGGHEMYLATGFDQPYHCFLVDMPPNESPGDGFMTMYDNRTFRRYLSKNKNFKFTFRIDDDMIYMLCEFDWKAVMNGIPQNGGFWEFDSIHWERGGWSWGGTRSVHNRSGFGRLVFANMTPENRTAIKRRLLSFAKKAFNAQQNQNVGLIGSWQDRELGDPKFYEEVIIPFNKKYSAYANAITPDMTDEQVNEVYDNAYEVLINTEYILAQMRKDYVTRQLSTMKFK